VPTADQKRGLSAHIGRKSGAHEMFTGYRLTLTTNNRQTTINPQFPMTTFAGLHGIDSTLIKA
jgi:hypothetical protein